ncbi:MULTISPECIES: class E sortase [Corynebacterium]|uniref:Class E sortase n=1 Tax=Corynebacterium kefirresidentii TaxID=1979527 RepID=A0ABT8Q8J4_9CORY|nr:MULTISPECIES: class E sortase [Corynebacterium]MCG7450777.1 class E sortase [Corynebacterium kefirresidentii]MCG7453076.1 class E sortase [Corynebacterium kefirresidentii]MCK6083615.1 class E sortase [Corynebacterium kefirresidentii]MCT2188588.1 class E sortase [Corynebacterium kefirresidentii]MDK8585496.1 class E sortase [Corynebacterium kefirresidentii]
MTKVLGELMLTIGVVLLLFAFYEAYWTNVESGQLQEEASADLEEQWRNPRQKMEPELGEAFAQLYIPTFGSDYHFAIIEGTNEDDLLRGPGRYVDSQMPGEMGNFAVAGHRVGKGAPFNDLGKLETCDDIVVETQTERITYRVLPIDGEQADCFNGIPPEYSHVVGRHITTPGDVSVTNPVPESDAAPNREILTLTTCHPQFSNAERMIVHAMEVEKEEK